MAGNLKKAILKDVRSLIENLAGFDEEDDNFKACEQFVMSNLLYHRFLSVDGHAIRRSIDGVVEKFQVNGHIGKAKALDTLVKSFLASDDFKDHPTADIDWALLSFVLHMAENPTNVTSGEEETDFLPLVPAASEAPTTIDWAAILRQGEEQYEKNWNEPSDSEEEDAVDLCESLPKYSFNLSTFPGIRTVSQKQISSTPKIYKNSTPKIDRSKKDDVRAAYKQRVIMNLKKINESEVWLKKSMQTNFCGTLQFKPSSGQPSANLCKLWDKNVNNDNQTSILPERNVILEVLWSLMLPSNSILFQFDWIDNIPNCVVQPNFSVSSLTPSAFKSILDTVGGYLEMVFQIQSFASDLLDSVKKIKSSNMYREYSIAVQAELKPLNEKIIELERIALKQEKTITLCEVIENLNPRLEELRSLYELHKEAILDWNSTPNWLCDVHLLSVLLSHLQRSSKHTSIFFRIFIRSFSIYVNIIDEWLIGGELFDLANEFLITRCEDRSESSILGAMFKMQNWEQELSLKKVKPPVLLQTLADRLLLAARSFHVLHQMNRLTELHSQMVLKRTLNTQFIESVANELETFQISGVGDLSELPECDQTTRNELLVDEILISEGFGAVDEVKKSGIVNELKELDVRAHLLHVEDPLLEEAFSDIINFGINLSSDTSKQHKETSFSCLQEEEKEFDRLTALSIAVGESIPVDLEACLNKAVYRLSTGWENVASSMVANILMQEQNLLHHLHCVQNVYFLQVPSRLYPFIIHLFKLIENSGDSFYSSAHTLSVILQDCLDVEQVVIKITPSEKVPADCTVLDFIDSLHLHYEVEWPVSAIIGEGEHVYNLLFRFLLKLKWGLWTLQGLNLKEMLPKENDGRVRRLLYLRFQLLHLLQGSYTYLAGHTLNALRLSFETDMSSAKDIHTIVRVHRKLLQTANEKCLKADQKNRVKTALYQLLVLVDKLRSMWKNVKEISANSLLHIEECYAKTHFLLATILHYKAEDDHHLLFLSDIFQQNIPIWKDCNADK